MYMCPYIHSYTNSHICTHSHSILTHMYVHIHSDIPTHGQKCTCTGIAVISSPSSGFCPVHKARSPYSLQVTSQVFICSLFLPVSQFSIWKVVPIINRICPRSSPHPHVYPHNSLILEEKISRPESFLPVPRGMVHCSQIPKQLLEQRKKITSGP